MLEKKKSEVAHSHHLIDEQTNFYLLCLYRKHMILIIGAFNIKLSGTLQKLTTVSY